MNKSEIALNFNEAARAGQGRNYSVKLGGGG